MSRTTRVSSSCLTTGFSVRTCLFIRPVILASFNRTFTSITFDWIFFSLGHCLIFLAGFDRLYRLVLLCFGLLWAGSYVFVAEFGRLYIPILLCFGLFAEFLSAWQICLLKRSLTNLSTSRSPTLFYCFWNLNKSSLFDIDLIWFDVCWHRKGGFCLKIDMNKLG